MRGIEHLIPEAQAKANELVELCLKNGLAIKITDTLRSKSEQDELYSQGRTKPGNIVTNVKYPNSMHSWGVAFDFCRNDGKGAYEDRDGFFTKVGKLGVSIGLIWGGNWTSIIDKPHFQLAHWGDTPTELKRKYGTPEKFFNEINGTNIWEGKKLITVKNGSRGWSVTVLQAILLKDYPLKVDGIFGKDTEKYVREYQSIKLLKCDGIVGGNTWKALINELTNPV